MTSTDNTGLLAPGRVGTAVEEATSDDAVVAAMLDAEAALTRAQASLGLAPASAATAVSAASRDRRRFDARELAVKARAGGNPVIPLVAELTAATAERDAAAAAYVHRGATSQDILDTAIMLVAVRAIRPTLSDLLRAEVALARMATHHRDTVMPGRTLTQHAVPTTFGLKAAGWRSLVLDAHRRLAAAAAALPAQLGGAAGTLAAFGAFEARPQATSPLDLVAAYAVETGLVEPLIPWHTLRTPVADLGGALAFAAVALGKVAADVLVMSRTEIGEIQEGNGGGSSAMPHKHNPVRATLIAASARQVPALASVLLTSVAAEDERPPGAWHAEWQPLREALRLVGGAARDTAELVETLHVRPDRMLANLAATGGLIVSEHLAAALSPLLGRAEAKRRLGDAGYRVIDEGLTLAEALALEPSITEAIDPARLCELVDPTNYLGSAGALVDRALSRRAVRRESA